MNNEIYLYKKPRKMKVIYSLLLAFIGVVSLSLYCGLFLFFSAINPIGMWHTEKIDYYYNVGLDFEEDSDSYWVSKPIVYNGMAGVTDLYIPMDKTYVVFIENTKSNILVEMTYISALYNNKHTEYKLYIFPLAMEASND